MNINTVIGTINFFNKAPVSNNNEVDFRKINEKAILRGYLIHPSCCNEYVDKWLDFQTVNYNATFYSKWYDIISKNRFELYLDQIMHYLTTYGTDFAIGNGYVPNCGTDAPDYKSFKVIEPITMDELFQKCFDMIKAGVALNSVTIKTVTDFITEFLDENTFFNKIDINLDEIKCKEAQAVLSVKMKRFPSDEFGILRCLMYYYTEKTSIIKNKSTVKAIKIMATDMGKNNPICSLSDDQINRLSRIFYRFKPLFLAMKTKYNASKVNHLRKLAKKNHTPLKVGFWESLISVEKPVADIVSKVEDIDNFKKIRLLQSVKVALYSTETDKVYVIRNGKMYVREGYAPKYNKQYLHVVEDILEDSLIKSLSQKACKVKFPKWFDIKLPSSEKSFIGNYPFGTTVDMTTHNIVGIYWRNEWNDKHHTDYDLSILDKNGGMYSWCNDFRNNAKSIVYSGDMTNASPEASEIFYMSNEAPDGVVRVNKFSGAYNGKFRFFVANEEIGNVHKNYMVDPNNIKFDVMVDSVDASEQIMGLLHDNKFTLMNLESGKCRVARGKNYMLNYIETMSKRCFSYVSLKEILLKAGFVEDNENPDIDFTDLEKDTLINLLSK